jgi:CRISPR-associated endonuclease/helicase Cas3
MRCWAYSDPNRVVEDHPQARWQLLREHLCAVGASAAKLGRLARPHDEGFIAAARAAGLLHDFGKYSTEFQELIRGQRKRAEHSGYGAALAGETKAWGIAFAIAGHHARKQIETATRFARHYAAANSSDPRGEAD